MEFWKQYYLVLDERSGLLRYGKITREVNGRANLRSIFLDIACSQFQQDDPRLSRADDESRRALI